MLNLEESLKPRLEPGGKDGVSETQTGLGKSEGERERVRRESERWKKSTRAKNFETNYFGTFLTDIIKFSLKIYSFLTLINI